MNIPKGFVSKKGKKEIEEIVKKTLVKEILVEDLAKKLEVHFENKALADRISIYFRKLVCLTKNKNSKIITERFVETLSRYNSYDIKHLPRLIKAGAVYDHKRTDKTYPWEKEIPQITERIRELEPDIKEEEIHYTASTIEIFSEDFIYELSINSHEQTEREETNKKIEVGRAFKRTVPIINIHHNTEITGEVRYAKFDRKHHKKIVQALKENDYEVSLHIN